MACTVKELRVFLAGCDGEDMIGVDDGGLTLVVVDDPGTFFEIGGIPLDDEHPDGCYHVECGKLPACECGMALAEAGCCCSGTKEEVAGYVKVLKEAGWKGAHLVEGPCPSTK